MRKSVWIERLDSGYSVRYYSLTVLSKSGKPKKEREWFEEYTTALRRKTELQLSLLAKKQNLLDPTLKTQFVFDKYKESMILTHRPTTLDLKDDALKGFIMFTPIFKNIIRERIIQHKTNLVTGYSISTASIRLRELRAFCKWATKEKYFTENPFTDIPIPASAQKGRKLEIEDLNKLINLATPRFKPYLLLLIYTGCRRGELYRAEWKEFDLDNAIWNIPKEHTKTNTSRSVPLDLQCVEALRDLTAIGSLVFQGWSERSSHYMLKRTLKRADIKGRVTLHDLRHTFVSHWKGDPRILADMVGWTSLAMLKRYSHFKIEQTRQAAQSSGIASQLNTPNTSV